MPTTDKIVLIENLFNVSLDYLLKEENEDEEEQSVNEEIYTNTTQAKNINQRFIFGLVIFSLGIIGIMIFCVLYVLRKITTITNEIKVIFLSFCLLSIIGLIIISINIITKSIKKLYITYTKQTCIIKVGITLLAIGFIMILPSLTLMFNQTIGTKSYVQKNTFTGEEVLVLPNTDNQISIFPCVFHYLSAMAIVSGIVIIIIGVIKKKQKIIKQVQFIK